mmetsp:Transcript_23437/g.65042  ORF Transcript_23437/g.65042 Transcript_23437/m.65042 type:complete len:299 (+) Transcript_23437:98-994(+)
MTKFTTEGFDLDAGTGDSGDVVFEIGGGITGLPKEEEAEAPSSQCPPEEPPSPLDRAEEWKQRGNEEFRKKNFLEAYDMYTEAIEACPCPVTVDDILRQRDEFDEREREKARSRMEEESRQRKTVNNEKSSDEDDKGKHNKSQSDSSEGPVTFELQPQEYGDKLAIFLNNRSASLIQMERFEEAIKDADVSILLNPRYTKAYIRRSTAYEKTERTDEALRDMKCALELEPSNATLRKSVRRLQKLEDERLEKLKEETMSKLKDLGNSLLGNFGLSMDNFNAVQDPNTGSYSISFNQNK